MKTLILVGLLLGVTSCAHKVKILDASAVSMTKYSLEPGENLVEVGEVDGEFCPDSFNDKGQIGLLDEAIMGAQKKSGADFITNASFWRNEKGCVSVTGTGKKISTSPVKPVKQARVK